jgi:hypothetical protein
MLGVVIEFCKEHWPVGILIILAVIITWNVAKYYQSFKHVKKAVDELPCKEHGDKFSVMDRLDELARSTNKIVVEISKWVMKRDNTMIDTLQKASPYRIMSYGYALLNESFAKKCVDENFNFFKERINNRKPETELDVENAAISLAAGSMDENFMNPVKEFLYHSPEKIKLTAKDDDENEVEKEMVISSFLLNQLIGIYVRDKYLELFPGAKTKFYTE